MYVWAPVRLVSNTTSFRGFMIQARASELGSPLGTFSVPEGDKSQTLQCSQPHVSERHAHLVGGVFSIEWCFVQDTAAHANRNDVNEVVLNWRASALPEGLSNFSF